jgi:hypothetical protein
MSIGSPLLFVRGDAHAESIRSREVHRSGASCFDVKHVGSLAVCAFVG